MAHEEMSGSGYKLRKAPKRELYWVVNKETGKKHSKDPIPLDRAKSQMKALYSATSVSGEGRPDEQIDARAFQLALMRIRGKTEAYILAVLNEMVDDEGNRLDKGMRDTIYKKYKHYIEHPDEMELQGGAIPDRSLLWKIAKATYSKYPRPKIDTLSLIRSTPTLKFYKEGKTIVVGIRGTKPTEVGDLKADVLLAVNYLSSSERYKNDVAILQEVQKEYPPSEYEYYGVGHSLGGAVLDNLIKQGLLDSGVSYNPAVQPSDWQKHVPNKRIYMSDDPLYLLMGQHTIDPEVRKNRKKGLLETVIGNVPYLGKAYGSLQAHKLNNFIGGKKIQLSDAEMTPQSYLRKARTSAKKNGYDPSRLELSNKKTHKLMYKTEDGKIVHFGRTGYGDSIIWSALERLGKAPKGTADKKRRVFHASHSKIKGDWRDNPHSANNLALRVLW